MLLYVFRDGTAKQVQDNPSVLDLLAVRQGGLSIYKYSDKQYLRLIFEDDFKWEQVENEKIISCSEGRLHI